MLTARVYQCGEPSPAAQNLMGPTQVEELPLNNRNFVQLATLVPGVSSDLSDEVGIGLTSTVSISINGGRRNAVNWRWRIRDHRFTIRDQGSRIVDERCYARIGH